MSDTTKSWVERQFRNFETMVLDPKRRGYPDYCEVEKNRVLAQLEQLYDINNPIVIGFSTDQHLRDTWDNTYPNILPNLRTMAALTKEFPFNVCVLGGDASSTTTDVKTLQADVLAVSDCLKDAECPVFHLIGNHDGAGNIPSINPSAVYGSHRTKALKDNVAVTMGENTTCYYDDKSAKVRFIFITSTNLVGYSTSQGKAFLLNALSTMPNDYEAIIFSHHPMGTLTDDTSTRFDDWNEPLGWSSDLAPYKDKIIACISGHVHDDRHEIVDGILYLATTCAGFTELNDGTTRNDKLGTAQCTAYDVFVIDRATYTIHCIRYGIGSNRDIVYRVPDYVNQIPISTDSEGNVYNETGYKTGSYLASDGSETTRTGQSVTGFIPVKGGDVVRFKNCGTISNDATVDRVGLYNANKNSQSTGYIRTNNDGSPFTKEGNVWNLNIVTDSNGVVQQLTIPTVGSSATSSIYYIRVTGSSIGENSVITVNEPIN